MKILFLQLWSIQDVMSDVTCYTCDTIESGQCNITSHLSEYCGQTDWCVKTWRGNGDDQMSGMLSIWELSTTQPFGEVKRPGNIGVMGGTVGIDWECVERLSQLSAVLC